MHRSVPVQPVPSGAGGFWQPVFGSHTPARWHASPAAQVTVDPPAQTPAWHVSPCVHAFPSLHAVPLLAKGFEHAPELMSHVPATWHWSLAVHVTGFDPTHAPL